MGGTVQILFLSKQAPSDFLQQVSALLQNFPPSEKQVNAHRNLKELMETIKEIGSDASDFESYMSNESEQNPTLTFGYNSCSEIFGISCTIYLAMRGFTNDSYKTYGTAFDRPKYSKLIPLHIHEMCINKDCKEYITRPSAEHMSRLASFLPVKAKAIKNLESQIFADSKAKQPNNQVTSLHSGDPTLRAKSMRPMSRLKLT